MSLSEKAKFAKDIAHTLNEAYANTYDVWKTLQLEEWVRLEDARQEIDKHGKNNKALAEVCSNLNDKIERLERERGEQKQKLRGFYVTLVVMLPKTVKIEEYDSETKELWIVQTADPSEWSMFIDSLDRWFVKFKELLK